MHNHSVNRIDLKAPNEHVIESPALKFTSIVATV